ncbi:restriction endonuclease subunit S [Nocardia tengchongensis]
MSRIDELILELCPGGVEHKALGDVGKFVRGIGLQKKDLIGEGIPAIHYGQIHTHYGVWATVTKSFTSPEVAAKLRHAKPGDLLIATTSEDDAAVAKATAWIGSDDVVLSGDAYIYQHNLDPKYMAYFFQSNRFHEQKAQRITGAKVRRISGDSLGKIQIPVPPIEVQQEIVRVLDQFTQLEADLETELEAELELRIRQHEHHRDSLLTVSAQESFRQVPMGEVGQFIRGRRFTKMDVVPSGIPSIHYGEIYTHYGVCAISALNHVREDLASQLRYARTGDVVFAGVGETVEDVGKAVAWLGDSDVAIHDDTFLFRSDLNPKYVAYLAQTADFNSQKTSHVARGKVKRLSGAGLAKIAIPLPDRAKQDRIAEILDEFGALVNDLRTSISAERAARRQQYEYYREHLLTFKEATR